MKFTIWLLFVFAFFLSCGRNKKCNQEDSFSGIVVQQLTLQNSFLNENLVRVDNTNGFIIRNDSVYKVIFSQITNRPVIDFTQYDLLGLLGNGSCKISFHKEVTADTIAKIYHYKLSAYSCSTYNQKGCFSHNWVVVPKLPQGWTVTFESIKNR